MEWQERAVAAVRAGLTSPEPRPPVIITGQPGSGRSTLAVRTARGAASRDDLLVVFDARGAIHADLLTLLGQEVDTPRPPVTRAHLVDEFGSAHPADDEVAFDFDDDGSFTARYDGEEYDEEQLDDLFPVWRVVVDGLDQASNDQERAEIVRTVATLSTLRCLRFVVTTSPGPAGARRPAPDIVEIDNDEYFDPAALRASIAAVLARDGDGARRDRLVDAVAARAGRSFLVATLAAGALSVRPDGADPAPEDIPHTVPEALDACLDTVDGSARECVRALLVALAYARGAGMDDGLLLRCAAALHPELAADDLAAGLERLRSGPVARLVEVTDRAGEPVRRVAHQVIAEALRAGRVPAADDRALLLALLPGSSAGWLHASSYLRRYAADHAVAGGMLDLLLDDPRYLVVADPARLLAVLPPDLDPRWAPTVEVVRTSYTAAAELPPDRRAALLALAAASLGQDTLSRRFAALRLGAYTPVWAHPVYGHSYEPVFDPFPNTKGSGRFGDRDVFAKLQDDWTVHVWDHYGIPVATPIPGDHKAVAVGRLGGRDVIVTGDGAGQVSVWDPDGSRIAVLTADDKDATEAVAVGRLGAVDVIAACGWRATRVWDAQGNLLASHGHGGGALAIRRLGDRDVLVVYGSTHVRVWDDRHQTLGVPLKTAGDAVSDEVAYGRLGEHDVVVRLTDGNTIDLLDRQPAPATANGEQREHIKAVGVGRLGDRTVVVTTEDRGSNAGDRGLLLLWDEHGHPVGNPIASPYRSVEALALIRIGDRDVIACQSPDGTSQAVDLRGNLIEAQIDPAVFAKPPVHRLGGRDVTITDDNLDGVRTLRIVDAADRSHHVIDLLAEGVGHAVHDDRLYVAMYNGLCAWRRTPTSPE